MALVKRWAWMAVAVVAAAAAGCEGEAPADDVALPEAGAGEPDTGSRFEQDGGGRSVPDTSSRQPELKPLDLGGDDPGAVPDGGDGEGVAPSDSDVGGATGADAVPETKPAVTTCEGHCGIYMEDNPCHCSVLCLSEGNCCAGFQELCKCSKDGDCDDGNDCTSDSCNKANGYCFQQPLKSCCKADSECPAGDACNEAKCISGTCTKQPKDCNDGIDCTLDFCEAGKCTNKINTKNCLLDGKCYKAGDQDPALGACATCDPAKKQDAWTAAPGKCAIDGLCLGSGEANPAAACAVCDATKSTTSWTVKSGNCLIDNKCYKAGDANPQSACQVCDPVANAAAWSGKAGFCAIDGQCIADKAANPADACQVCDVAKNKSGWTAKTGYCAIDGQCVANGKAANGSGGCKVCDVTKPGAWTLKPAGTTCLALGPCATTPKCDDAGVCTGPKKPGCCDADADCANDPGAVPGGCKVAACNLATGACVLKDKPDCCTDGVCCDKASSTFLPAGTACSTMASNYKYVCEGDTGYKIAQVAGCTGTSAVKCSSTTLADGAKTVAKKCSDGLMCVKSTETSFSCK
ncbi:MAG: hypothetical protein FJ100_03240 [Deltaproteobacteria bacterium]|nr:hypothetical protein [Deltaproteobacteria bacterium]